MQATVFCKCEVEKKGDNIFDNSASSALAINGWSLGSDAKKAPLCKIAGVLSDCVGLVLFERYNYVDFIKRVSTLSQLSMFDGVCRRFPR